MLPIQFQGITYNSVWSVKAVYKWLFVNIYFNWVWIFCSKDDWTFFSYRSNLELFTDYSNKSEISIFLLLEKVGRIKNLNTIQYHELCEEYTDHTGIIYNIQEMQIYFLQGVENIYLLKAFGFLSSIDSIWHHQGGSKSLLPGKTRE